MSSFMFTFRFVLFNILLLLATVEAKSKSSKSKSKGKSLPIPAKYALVAIGGILGLAGLVIIAIALRTKFFPSKKAANDEEAAPSQPEHIDEKSSSFMNGSNPEMPTPPAYSNEKEPIVQFPVPQLAPVPAPTGEKH